MKVLKDAWILIMSNGFFLSVILKKVVAMLIIVFQMNRMIFKDFISSWEETISLMMCLINEENTDGITFENSSCHNDTIVNLGYHN